MVSEVALPKFRGMIWDWSQACIAESSSLLIGSICTHPEAKQEAPISTAAGMLGCILVLSVSAED